MENIMKTNNQKKLPYIAPKVDVIIVALEEGFASGSAQTNPGNNNDQVKDQWDTGSDDNRTMSL